MGSFFSKSDEQDKVNASIAGMPTPEQVGGRRRRKKKSQTAKRRKHSKRENH
jgi:hypothetical protein